MSYKSPSPDLIYKRIKKFCAYQERSQKEVRNRLLMHGIKGEQIEEIIACLIEEGFINEERFAIQYAGGKFRMKRWGKVKIKARLQLKGISNYCIKQALDAITDEEYLHAIRELIDKRLQVIDRTNPLLKQHLYVYLLGKGYEPDTINQTITKYLKIH